MNNKRRAKIRKVERKLQKLIDLSAELQDDIDAVRMDEECMFDNMADWKQVSDLGVASEDAARDLQEAVDEMGYANTNFEEAMGHLKGVSGS